MVRTGWTGERVFQVEEAMNKGPKKGKTIYGSKWEGLSEQM